MIMMMMMVCGNYIHLILILSLLSYILASFFVNYSTITTTTTTITATTTAITTTTTTNTTATTTITTITAN